MCVTIRTMVYYTFELLLTLLCLCIYNNVKLRPWILQWLPMQEVLYIISESASLFEITHINQMCVISNVSFRRSYNNIRHIYIHTCSTFKTSGSLRPANGVGEPWMWAVTWWAVALSPRPRAETTEGEGEGSWWVKWVTSAGPPSRDVVDMTLLSVRSVRRSDCKGSLVRLTPVDAFINVTIWWMVRLVALIFKILKVWRKMFFKLQS